MSIKELLDQLKNSDKKDIGGITFIYTDKVVHKLNDDDGKGLHSNTIMNICHELFNTSMSSNYEDLKEYIDKSVIINYVYQDNLWGIIEINNDINEYQKEVLKEISKDIDKEYHFYLKDNSRLSKEGSFEELVDNINVKSRKTL